MNDEQKIIFLETTLARLLGWIQSADQKINFILTLDIAMLSTLVAILSSYSNYKTETTIFIIISILILLTSILFVSIAAFPRTKGTYGSLIFFGGISTKSLLQYNNQITNLNAQERINDLTEQCYINAVIAEKKFYWVKRSFVCLFIAVIPWISSIWLLKK